jgi:GNAT superfamily N-acetyltransferase
MSLMINARRALSGDAEELVRLRGVMLGENASEDGHWRRVATATLRTGLAAARPTLAAFVVDRMDREEVLAACAVGAIDQRLGGPGDPFGRTGYIFSVVTDPDLRRRGYSRSCVTALLGWYRKQGIRTVDLRASPAGEPLYMSLGFVRASHPGMRLRLTEDARGGGLP